MDYISKDELKRRIESLNEVTALNTMSFFDGIEHCLGIIDSLPVMEIVKCKQCAHYRKTEISDYCIRDWRNSRNIEVTPEDYCRFGEKK